jgi:predicted  nucleic acid-binding Zn-ribbon protein
VYSSHLKNLLLKAAQKTEALLEEEHKRVGQLRESLETLQQDSEIALHNERQTVSILVNEKTHLSAELQKREQYESRVCLS